MPPQFASPAEVMAYAIELARRGVGCVEPNPAVGAVLVDDQLQWISDGYHQQYGGPHAEVHALRSAGTRARGAHLFVTLEPCHHFGKTPPCSQAVIAAGIRRVTIACPDPAPHTSGGGLAELRQAGLDVEVGLLQLAGERLIRPFTKRMRTGLPYVIAKWAMTLDGKIATRTGSSQWISGVESREKVHQIRGRMDAILVGQGTVRADDPLLTARPPGPRTPLRVVLDARAELPLDSRLLQTLDQAPVLICCGPSATAERLARLQSAGAECLQVPDDSQGLLDLRAVLQELGRRGVTNLLVEGGGRVLGSLLDQRLIDEVHVFVAPKLVGGAGAAAPIAGTGVAEMAEALELTATHTELCGQDLYLQGEFPLTDSVHSIGSTE